MDLAEAAARRPIRAPYRLDLVALEESRQLALILRNHARERDRQVVGQSACGAPARFVLPPLGDFENELVAFFAVLAEERLDVLECRRLERLESVALIDVPDHADDVLPASDVVGKEVSGASRGLNVGRQMKLRSYM